MCHRQLYVSSVVKLYTDNNLEQRAYDVRVKCSVICVITDESDSCPEALYDLPSGS